MRKRWTNKLLTQLQEQNKESMLITQKYCITKPEAKTHTPSSQWASDIKELCLRWCFMSLSTIFQSHGIFSRVSVLLWRTTWPWQRDLNLWSFGHELGALPTELQCSSSRTRNRRTTIMEWTIATVTSGVGEWGLHVFWMPNVSP